MADLRRYRTLTAGALCILVAASTPALPVLAKPSPVKPVIADGQPTPDACAKLGFDPAALEERDRRAYRSAPKVARLQARPPAPPRPEIAQAPPPPPPAALMVSPIPAAPAQGVLGYSGNYMRGRVAGDIETEKYPGAAYANPPGPAGRTILVVTPHTVNTAAG